MGVNLFQYKTGGELLVIDEIHKYKPSTDDWDKLYFCRRNKKK